MLKQMSLAQSIVSQLNFCRTLRHLPKQTSVANRQNQFYFERSKLLDQVIVKDGLNDKTYRELYQRIPVVLILGWTGSKDSNVRKYEQIYSDLGYHTIRFAPSNKLTFLKSRLHKLYTNRLVEMINQLELRNNTFVTHMFSNAGCFIIYQHLLRDPAAQFFRDNHKSAIYDSALGLPHKCVRLVSGINNLLRPAITNQPLR